MPTLAELQAKIIALRDARDWKQFHNPKDLAISLVLEATEVLEHFQWKSPAEMDEHVVKEKSAIGAELADTLYMILLMSHDLDIDILAALEAKLKSTEEKYPVEKSKGRHTKYDKL